MIGNLLGKTSWLMKISKNRNKNNARQIMTKITNNNTENKQNKFVVFLLFFSPKFEKVCPLRACTSMFCIHIKIVA